MKHTDGTWGGKTLDKRWKNKGAKKRLLLDKHPDCETTGDTSVWVYIDDKPFASLSQIETLGAMGLTIMQICEYLNVSHTLLYKKAEASEIVMATINRGKLKANVKVAQRLFKAACADDPKEYNLGASVFWLKNRADWRDAIDNRHDVTGTLADLLKSGEERRNKMLNDKQS
jgi:hypothetical protein